MIKITTFAHLLLHSHPMNKYLLICFTCLLTETAFAQTFPVKGRITSPTGQPVPFASIYQQSTTRGTSANGEGEYQLNLPAGAISLIVKSVGYKQALRQLDLKAPLTLNIVLEAEVYQLQDVAVSAGEDPAYKIIRNAIAKRSAYLREPAAYSCDVYIKGLQKMLAAPKRFLGRNIDDMAKQMGLDSSRKGILYLSESESRYTVKLPDEEHEELISSKVSGRNNAFSWNRASELDVNFYENLQDWQGLTNRPLVSPIADNALSFYKYRLLGTISENGRDIHKIAVTPKRLADPAFTGTVYIIDDSWRLYSADLMLTKDANINFVDTVKVNQQFYPVAGDVWVPSTVRFDFVGGLFGFRFGGYYTAVYRNYDIAPALPKKLFREALRVTKESNQKDSTYWETARPVPLTPEEEQDYDKKDALAKKRESRPYLDSLDRVNNKFKPLQFVFGRGYTHRNQFEKQTFRFGPLLRSAFFNTVEGFGIDYTIAYSKQIDSANNRYFNVSTKLRYGLESRRFLPMLTMTLPVKGWPVTLSGGSDMTDMNNMQTISQSSNTINSLLFERNRLKLYQKDFFSVGLTKLLGAVSVAASAEWANRSWYPNATDYTIRDVKDRAYTSNNPLLPLVELAPFPDNQSMQIALRASYVFSRKYVTYPTGRYYLPSKYPALSLHYTKGLKGVFGSDVDYDFLAATLAKENVPLGLYGKFSFFTGAGKFVNNNSVFFTDYKHFAGNLSTRYHPRANGFLYLPIYEPATREEYFQLNTHHNFGGLVMNRLPLLRKLRLQEIVGFNYLANPGFKNYREFYYGLEFFGVQVLYGSGKQGNVLTDKGFRVVVGL